MEAFSNRSAYFLKSLIEPWDWYLVRIDGWPLFSKQKPIHWWEKEGNNTLVFLVFLLSLLWLCLLCFSLDSFEMVWLCLYSSSDFIDRCLRVLWPGTNSHHRTWWNLLACNPGWPNFSEGLQGPSRMECHWPKELGPDQASRRERGNPHGVALAGSSLHSD